MKKNPENCMHESFEARVHFALAPGADNVIRRWMVIGATCEECGTEMSFPNMASEYAVEIVPGRAPAKSPLKLVVDNALRGMRLLREGMRSNELAAPAGPVKPKEPPAA